MKKLLSWLKENPGLAVGALLSLGVLGYIYYSQVYVNYAKEAEATAKLEEKRTELDGLMRRKPFPHEENVVVLSNTVTALSGTNDDLSVARWLTNLAGVNPPPRLFHVRVVERAAGHAEHHRLGGGFGHLAQPRGEGAVQPFFRQGLHQGRHRDDGGQQGVHRGRGQRRFRHL